MARVNKPKHYENIVSFELAKLLRQNGFPQDTNRWGRSTDACHHYYNHLGELDGDAIHTLKYVAHKEEIPEEVALVAAPTHEAVCNWLREKNVHIHLHYKIGQTPYQYQAYITNCIGENSVCEWDIGLTNEDPVQLMDDTIKYYFEELV